MFEIRAKYLLCDSEHVIKDMNMMNVMMIDAILGFQIHRELNCVK